MRCPVLLERTHAAIPVVLALLAIPLTNGCHAKHNAPPPPLRAVHRAPEPHVEAESPELAGRYLVLVGGCNDCHTPDWDTSVGKLPESEWLTGKSVGFRGPWGTTYADNLRLTAQEHTEREWVLMFREQVFKPPMPGMNYVNMAERDLVAIYRFVRALGPKGHAVPEALPPGQEPSTPYILLEPREPIRDAP